MPIFENVFLSIIGFILTAGIVIIFHEFGHYLIAKLLNVKVTRFAIGFGRVIYSRTSKRKNGTEFAICALPFGGYISMLETINLKDEYPRPEESPDFQYCFDIQKIWKRMAIVLAGPIFNFILAIALFMMVNVSGQTGIKPIVGAIYQDSFAYKHGFREGDRIMEIDGKKISIYSDAQQIIADQMVRGNDVEVLLLTTDNKPKTVDFPVSQISLETENIEEAIGLKPIEPPYPVSISYIIPGAPSEKVGLKKGDLITHVNDIKTPNWLIFRNAIKHLPNQKIKLSYIREGKHYTIPVMLSHRMKYGKKIGFLGMHLYKEPGLDLPYLTKVNMTFLESIVKAHESLLNTTSTILISMGRLLIGDISLKNVSGPIGIADHAGKSIQNGWIQFLLFLAAINISVAILNLLPIPMLDGGLFLSYVIESFMRKPVHPKALHYANMAGFGIVLFLIGTTMANDVIKLL